MMIPKENPFSVFENRDELTVIELSAYLNLYNQWRRGADIEMPNPEFLGKAIDCSIECLQILNEIVKAKSSFGLN